MSEKILVPILGESITEATVSKWLKNEGESIQVDEPIVELETDKVNLEVPSPINGILSKINAKNGETVEVGAVLGLIDEKDNKSIQQKIKKVTSKEKEDNVVNLEIEHQKKNH
jgi:2-oxoglutarate dehydrogenase E2 component (dihydrolipoamide succinyltransferase)